jgi:hypothetical protein
MANTVPGGAYADAAGNVHNAKGEPVTGEALTEYKKQAAKREDEAARQAKAEEAQRFAQQATLANLLAPQAAPVKAEKSDKA